MFILININKKYGKVYMMKKNKYRIEKDSLGERKVPYDKYYGIQTLRAIENFPVSNILPKREFIKAVAVIKKAAAMTHMGLGILTKKKARAIIKASDEVIRGDLDKHFVVDVYQAGAGTSHHMNCNEVIANRAIEILKGNKGDYKIVHPNDDVNIGQSTNDVIPTAMRLGALFKEKDFIESLTKLEKEFSKQGKKYAKTIKSGRTHLQDAVPITFGQEFSSYASAIKEARKNLKRAFNDLKVLGIGGSAVGTGLNTHKKYRTEIIKNLKDLTGIRGLKKADDYFYRMNSMDVFVRLSGELRVLSIELTRIANDFRLLSSGPNTGLNEIALKPVQPGSSIMPGKVNPVMAEMLNMVCYQVLGHDETVKSASSAGQLELNVMMPVINYNILQPIEILTNGINLFTDKCVKDLKVNKERCEFYFENTVGLATVLNNYIGYENASLIAKESKRTGKKVTDIIIEKKILSEKELSDILKLENIIKPR